MLRLEGPLMGPSILSKLAFPLLQACHMDDQARLGYLIYLFIGHAVRSLVP